MLGLGCSQIEEQSLNSALLEVLGSAVSYSQRQHYLTLEKFSKLEEKSLKKGFSGS